MGKRKISDDAIVQGIKSGGVEQERVIIAIYEQYSYLVSKAVRKSGISEDQALSAYTDTILTFRKSVIEGTFRYESTISTFLNGIFFRKCGNAFQKNQTNKAKTLVELPDYMIDKEPGIQKILEIRETSERLLHYMEKLKEPCHGLLLDVAFWGLKMEEVADKYDLKDTQAARNKKWSCLRALKKIIANESTFNDELS